MNQAARFTETFIFMVDGNTVKVVMDFSRRIYTVYSANGRILVKRENMIEWKMRILRNNIKNYIDSKKGKSFRYKGQPYTGYKKI